MKRNWFLLIFCLLVPVNAWAQKKVFNKPIAKSLKFIKAAGDKALKVTSETQSFPGDYFSGHDSAALFNNLKYYLSQKAAAGKSGDELYQYLKGKPLLGKLTVDDWFVFSKYESESVFGVNENNQDLVYRGSLFRLRDKNEFPEPERQYVEQCVGVARADSSPSPRVSSKNELVSLTNDAPSDFWQNHILHLATVTPETRRRTYKGYNVGEQCSEFYVPSPQTHYGLAFTEKQLFQTVKVNEKFVFSLDTYNDQPVKGEGIAAWQADGEINKKDSYNKTTFIVKLAPPFISSENLFKRDVIERKPHRATQNKIYVDMVGVWFSNYETGEITKKYSGENSK